jgi:diamine N-acetyltransferase
MNITIRNANRSDYEALLPLFRQVHDLHVCERPDLYKECSTPVDEAYYERQLADVHQYISVACIGTEIVGFVVMREEEIAENSFVNARKVLLIDSLCVAEDQRKMGIGKKIMQHVFDFGKELKVESIELGVLEKNLTAIKFYESIGLVTKSRKMEFVLNQDSNIT